MAPLLLALAPAASGTPAAPPPVLAPVTAPAPAPAAPAYAPRRGGRLFISPMGEPFRSEGRGGDGLADWFAQADRNHDGRVIIEEMQQDAERFFALLDVNHDGEIDPDEITRYEDVVAPEIRGSARFDLASVDSAGAEDAQGGYRRGGGGGRGGGRGAHRGEHTQGVSFGRRADADLHQGAARFGLLDLPEPVVSADADFNRGVSLVEFRQAAAQRFLALDLDHHGYLGLAGLETIRPAPPAAPKAPERPKDPDESALPDQSY